MNNPQRLISMEETVKGLKRPLMIIALLGVVANLLILTAQITIFQKEEKLIQLTALEACNKSIQGLIVQNLDPMLLSEKLIRQIGDKVIKAEKIHLVKELDSYTCDVFTKDSVGVRRFKVSLDKSAKYPYGLKAIDISERKVTSRYQL